MNRQHNNTPKLALKQHLTLGLVAWVLLGGLTAVMDSGSTGIISMFGGIGAWLATGVGLALAYMAAFAAYHRRGWTAAGVAGGLSVAGVAVLVAVINWNTVMQAVLTIGGIAGLVALVYHAPAGTLSASYDDDNSESLSPSSAGIPDPYSQPAPSNVDASQWHDNQSWWGD